MRVYGLLNREILHSTLIEEIFPSFFFLFFRKLYKLRKRLGNKSEKAILSNEHVLSVLFLLAKP